jgi:predicted amidohydrolase
LKIITQIDEAGAQGCQLIVFGEGLLPGYPFWVELTDGAALIPMCKRTFMRIIFSRLFQLVKVTWIVFVMLQ